jgi:UDP-N-acetylglucosamine transferase subunit ALG13
LIFATVGTHEDPFDRLVLDLERIAEQTGEEIIIQTGYTRVPAPHCTVQAMMPFDEVQAHMKRARVVITHGGPASIMQAFAHGKVPIVVPRQSAFGEHVDDHQVRFSAKIADRVLRVLDIADLGPTIRTYAERTASMAGGAPGPDRARAFALKFDALCESVLGKS